MRVAKNSSQRETKMAQLLKYVQKNYLIKLITDPHYISFTCWLLLFGEVVLNYLIINHVYYTEIDWIAYMQEVEGFLNGTLNYQHLKGDTGPCVYPAGFLYIYSILYYVTAAGQNIKIAQYIFLVIYFMQMYLTYEIYKKTAKVPAYALLVSAVTSYRIHSIYVLRLFNDPIAVLFFYASLNAILVNKWKLASLLFSLGVSIKMNILLYAPALLAAYLICLGIKDTIINLFICALVQLILGLPFMITNFWAYLKASFDLGRVFEHKWTVNYRFLDKELFENPYFHIGLLTLHVFGLIIFLPSTRKYFHSYATFQKFGTALNKYDKELSITTKKGGKKSKSKKAFKPTESDADAKQVEKMQHYMPKTSQLLVLPFFVANLIGVSCARSLHYQFYSWYFHSLLYLVYSTSYSIAIKFLLLALIEYCWNVYPSTIYSSLILHSCHGFLLVGVFKTMNKKK